MQCTYMDNLKVNDYVTLTHYGIYATVFGKIYFISKNYTYSYLSICYYKTNKFYEKYADKHKELTIYRWELANYPIYLMHSDDYITI